MGAVTTVENQVGARSNYVMWYAHWSGPGSVFDVASTQAVINHGSTPIVSWISDDAGASQDAFPTPAIASGQFDGYIQSWAQAVKQVHGTILLRFDYEMNGNWSAYDAGVDGQTALDYVNAWRHVHDVFAAAGVTNVRWVWSPNVVYNGSTPLALLYPGDAYVDWVGVDGYNWGPSDVWHTWQSFNQVFAPTIAQLQALTSRPLMISEVASGTLGGDKAAWITDMFHSLAAQPNIKAFVWFDANKEEDWRIDSSSATLAAFHNGLFGS